MKQPNLYSQKSLFCFFMPCLFLLNLSSVKAQSPYWQQEVNFRIQVALNDTAHSLDAFEEIEYINHSPDTLRFIWFHLWPNAYKSDRTAFSEQMLRNNRTDFYFSKPEQKGYINRLGFEVDGVVARTEDHPNWIDVVKVVLPQPLLPGATVHITTPFHVQLPANFSRGGHSGQSYQVTQWYPKPAVYDRKGWHEMPYLDQGEYYSEFGRYEVSITVPAPYVVAATGELQNKEEKEWLLGRRTYTLPKSPVTKGKVPADGRKVVHVPAAVTTSQDPMGFKTLLYKQAQVHDFAWFADKRFRVEQDTIDLPSGRVVTAYTYYLPGDSTIWKEGLPAIREAVRNRSRWLGEYPYETVSAVEAQLGFSGGMEYPAITALTPVRSKDELRFTIGHEVGHNWLYGVLATNERDHPWMDEGMNTYYDGRSRKGEKAGELPQSGRRDASFATREERLEKTAFDFFAGVRKDQPVNTPADGFTRENYALVAYYKTGEWMRKLEQSLGTNLFDSCMRAYYRRWQFRHPYPEDFRQVMEETSQRPLCDLFALLDKKGTLDTVSGRIPLRLQPVVPWAPTDKAYFLSVGPSLGYNLYDGVMIGGLVHNYQLPLKAFSFLAAPMYAVKSRRFSGIARASYTWYPASTFYKVTAGVGAALFSINEFQPAAESKLFPRVRKLAPFIRLTLPEDPLAKRERFVQLRSFLVSEGDLRFQQVITGPDTSDLVSLGRRGYFVNQLRFVLNNYRALYPYSGEFQVEQGRQFIRTTFTGHYFFNYASQNGGLDLRFFAGKFLYTGARTSAKEFETDRFHLDMTGPKGEEDYTYSNYFLGRNRFDGLASQQIMMRDGAFKVRTDLLSSKVGKSDNWLSSLNFTADIPRRLNPLQGLPVKIPLKVFADVGTWAGAWNRDANTDRFLFDAGIELSLFKETVNLYVPLLYSRVYRDYFKSTLGTHRFWKVVSFSIDLQHLNWRKLDPGIPL